jgi:hypothetical protein
VNPEELRQYANLPPIPSLPTIEQWLDVIYAERGHDTRLDRRITRVANALETYQLRYGDYREHAIGHAALYRRIMRQYDEASPSTPVSNFAFTVFQGDPDTLEASHNLGHQAFNRADRAYSEVAEAFRGLLEVDEEILRRNPRVAQVDAALVGFPRFPSGHHRDSSDIAGSRYSSERSYFNSAHGSSGASSGDSVGVHPSTPAPLPRNLPFGPTSNPFSISRAPQGQDRAPHPYVPFPFTTLPSRHQGRQVQPPNIPLEPPRLAPSQVAEPSGSRPRQRARGPDEPPRETTTQDQRNQGIGYFPEQPGKGRPWYTSNKRSRSPKR